MPLNMVVDEKQFESKFGTLVVLYNAYIKDKVLSNHFLVSHDKFSYLYYLLSLI